MFIIFAYVCQCPSLLFGDLIPKRSAAQTVQGLVASVKNTRRIIAESFGPDMHYDGDVHVLKFLGTSEQIEKELSILANCSHFKISATDIAIFRTVQLLYEMSEPLLAFAFACWNCKLPNHMSSHDAALMEQVERFYSSQSSNRNACLAFLDQLFSILCIHPEATEENEHNRNGYDFMLHKRYEVAATKPLLLPVSIVARGPKLWDYCREMKWLGKEGHRSFQRQYISRHETFAQYLAVDELNLLKSMEQVIEIFSEVGSALNCDSLYELLETLKGSHIGWSDINVTALMKNVEQLDGRLHAIIDLFPTENCRIITQSNDDDDKTLLARSNVGPLVESCLQVQSPSTVHPFVASLDVTYGSSKQAMHLRRWLEYHSLPSTVVDTLIDWGVRSVDDVFILLSHRFEDDTTKEFLSQFPLLNRIKLLDAAKEASSASPSVAASATSFLSEKAKRIILPGNTESNQENGNDFSLRYVNIVQPI
jgi:hypothetical protein